LVGPPQAPLLVRLAYRTISGNVPRVCFWEDGPNRCARLAPLLRSSEWRRLDATVTPDPGTRSLRLFLYADGGSRTQTVTEYRDLRIARARRMLAVGAAPVGLPALSYRRVAPYEFKVSVRNPRGPFLLVLTETYAPGWHVEARDRGAGGLAHLRINGYANGWRIPWTGTYELTITYAPQRLAGLAGRADLVLIPLSLLLFLVVRRKPKRNRQA
jgi:hypothetical protein